MRPSTMYDTKLPVIRLRVVGAAATDNTKKTVANGYLKSFIRTADLMPLRERHAVLTRPLSVMPVRKAVCSQHISAIKARSRR